MGSDITNVAVNAPPPSIEILRNRIHNYFKKKQLGNYAIISNSYYEPFKAGTQNIVLIGDGAKVLFKDYMWPKVTAFHLWTLSNAMNEIVSYTLRLPYPNKYVSTIPRYELFPAKRKKYELAKSTSFVYAGRDSQGKNLDLLIQLVAELRKFLFPNHNLHIFHPGKDIKLPKRSWIRLHGNKGENWHRTLEGRPVFVSLSHYCYEDFSVSSAQAEEAGMPLIVPDWFAFRDIQNEGNLKLSALPISLAEKRDPQKIVKIWRRELIEKYERNSINHQSTPTLKPSLAPIKFFSLKQICQRLESLSKEDDLAINTFFSRARFWENTAVLSPVLARLCATNTIYMSLSAVQIAQTLSRSEKQILNAVWNLHPSMRIRLIADDRDEAILFKNGERIYFVVDGLARDIICSLGGQSPVKYLIEQCSPGILKSSRKSRAICKLLDSLQQYGVLQKIN